MEHWQNLRSGQVVEDVSGVRKGSLFPVIGEVNNNRGYKSRI